MKNFTNLIRIINEDVDHRRIAQEAISYLGNACGDLAYEYGENKQLAAFGLGNPEIDNMIKRAKAKGVRDITGWLADELYNDADTIQDFLGDWLADKVSNDGDRNAVLDVIMTLTSSTGIQEAAKRLKR